MRDLSPAIETALQSQYGIEAINIVGIKWGEFQETETFYGDKEVAGAVVKPNILALSGLDFVINVDDGSDSAEISITLSDTDGELKTIIDTNDIHKREVWVYQHIVGADFSDKSVIFQGCINSPIEWDEGSRTLSFNVVSKIEDAEIGFSIEEGKFPNPPQELIGVPWPLKFGTTYNVPAVRATSPIKGVLTTGVGIKDFTLPFRLQSAKGIICPQVFRGYVSSYLSSIFPSALQIIPIYATDESCALQRCETISNLQTQLDEQSLYEFETITVIDGKKFPQGTEITLNINGGKFTGNFTGTEESPSNDFVITSREHPKLAEIGVPTRESVLAAQRARLTSAVAKGCSHLTGGQDDGYGGKTAGYTQPSDPSRQNLEASQRSQSFFDSIPSADFFWAEPGATVTLDAGDPLVYISNIVPEQVINIAAKRRFEAGEKLVTVPEEYYTTRVTNYGTYNVSEVVLERSLSSIDDTWSDDIYVTSTSTVGPNTVDIIQWLIDTYIPSYNRDSDSFTTVRSLINNYPSDFPILERKNILAALREICFQARCAIYVRNRTFYLKYLPLLPDAVATITASDVDANTLKLSHTDTESIVTKLVAEWRRDYSIDEPNKVILRHNVQKYGTQEETFNFYIYNELDYVQKSATFWMLRKANTWRLLKFSTPIHLLKLETFDGVDIDLSVFSSQTVRSLISKANYNSETKKIDFEIWTPVRSGSTVPYDFAWPADIDEDIVWPVQEDYDLGNVGSGNAPGFSAIPPAGHPLSIDYGLTQGFAFGSCESQGGTTKLIKVSSPDRPFSQRLSETCGGGNGDRFPSDRGDTIRPKNTIGELPPNSPVSVGQINLGGTNYSNFGVNQSQIQALQSQITGIRNDVAAAKAEAISANEAAGGRGSGSQPNTNSFNYLPKPEDLDPDQCQFIARVSVLKPTILFQGDDPTPQDTGKLGSGDIVRIDEIVFATECEATQIKDAIEAYYAELQASEGFSVNEEYPVTVSTYQATDCEIEVDCTRQKRDEGTGDTLGYPPTPIAYRNGLSSGEEDDGPGDPGDYYNVIINNVAEVTCKRPREDCFTDGDLGANGPDEVFVDPEAIQSAATSAPIGPQPGETWQPGDQ